MMRIQVRGVSELSGRLDSFPKALHRRLRIWTLMSVRDIEERARKEHVFISRTGETERSIDHEVIEEDTRLSGRVFTSNQVAIYQHEGTKGHNIVPRKKKALRWVSPHGGIVFAKRAYVKGIKADPFIYQAAKAEAPVIYSRISYILSSLEV